MLNDFLQQKKARIAERWLEEVYRGYPSGTGILWKRAPNQCDNPFGNPVGHTLARETGAILELLLEGKDPAGSSAFAPPLENMLKIRAVQDLSASQAVSFVFLLKEVIRSELAGDLRGGEFSGAALNELMGDLVELNGRLDRLALEAFDLYMKCRERICELRINEVKRRVSSRLERARGAGRSPPASESLVESRGEPGRRVSN